MRPLRSMADARHSFPGVQHKFDVVESISFSFAAALSEIWNQARSLFPMNAWYEGEIGRTMGRLP